MKDVFCTDSEMVDRSEQWTNRFKYTHSFPFRKRFNRPKQESPFNLYVKRGLSAKQVADKLGVSKAFVLSRLHEMGIRKGGGTNRLTNPKNYRSGAVPYGYRVKGGKLVLNHKELELCRQVVKMVNEGMSFRAVARELVKCGLENRVGVVKWGHATVTSIYRSWKGKV